MSANIHWCVSVRLSLLHAGMWLCVVVFAQYSAADDAPARDDAVQAMHRAVNFFRKNCSAGGGYVYRVSSDLQLRQGENPVGLTTAWIEPPGTPAVGMAYLEAYRLTRDPLLLDAAKETADALIRGQLVSGGWDNQIEFDPDDRRRYAYRVDVDDPTNLGKRRNYTTFDDDKSQSAIRFLMQLDQELDFKDARLHEAVEYAIDAVLRMQYPIGAWPQRFDRPYDPADFPVLQASIPKTWPRKYSGEKYTAHYTLNDGTISDLITTLIDAWDIYEDDRYRDAARLGGSFFLQAQLPHPQPGWAQQYNRDMHPAWARKFEPPAVTGGESQGVMQTLLLLYRRTGDYTFLEPIPRALAYYRTCLRDDGKLARFYELHTNKPLYFTRDYQLTYSDADMPTHYGFIVSSKLDRIEQEYQRVRGTPTDDLWKSATRKRPKMSTSLTKRAAALIDALDDRGAWIERGKIEVRGGDTRETDTIESRTFCKNLTTLAEFIAASESN